MRMLNAVVLLLVCVSGHAQAHWLNQQADIMGTRISVTLWHAEPAQGQKAIDAVLAEMQRIDNHYSPYKPDSELAQMNASAGIPTTPHVAISDEMTRLLDKSLYYGQLTNGAFDITFASLARYYDYRAQQQPSAQQREALLPAIDYRHVELDARQRQVRYRHPAVHVDLGGIAKGYAVDRAIGILREHGITQASVSAGGDSRVVGSHGGRPWMIGIKQPRGGEDIAITLPLENTAVSTSGDYERFFIDESGQRVHHIINPRTGKSTEELASVTILGPNAFDTDALSTSVFVLGREQGLALIESMTAFDAIIIDRKGKVHFSSGLTTPAQTLPQAE